MVAFSGFYESQEHHQSGNVPSIIPPHRDGYKNGQQESGYILYCCFVDCPPGGRWDNTERVVAQWRNLVASGEALLMLQWAMCSVLCNAMAIKMARDGGTFICRRLC